MTDKSNGKVATITGYKKSHLYFLNIAFETILLFSLTRSFFVVSTSHSLPLAHVVYTRYEFLEVMLVILGKVDSELIDELREYFDQLDVNGSGILCQEDLIEIARRNLRNCTKRKLELHTYKQTLMEKARREKQQQKEQERRQSSYSSRGGRQSSISSFFSSFSIANDTAAAAATTSTRSNSCNDSNVVGAGGRDRRSTLGLILQRTKQRTERFTRGPSMRSRASSDTSINQH